MNRMRRASRPYAGELAARKLDEKVEGMRDDMAKMGNMVADLSTAMGKFMGRPNE